MTVLDSICDCVQFDPPRKENIPRLHFTQQYPYKNEIDNIRRKIQEDKAKRIANALAAA